jgi:hypothetical protein
MREKKEWWLFALLGRIVEAPEPGKEDWKDKPDSGELDVLSKSTYIEFNWPPKMRTLG